MNISTKITALCAGILLATGVGMAGASVAYATNPNAGEKVCEDLDTGHLSGGSGDTFVYNAPAGKLVDFYCVKAGSSNQEGDNGPVIVQVDPNAASVVINHPVRDSISHFSVKLVDDSVSECVTAVWSMPSWIGPQSPSFDPYQTLVNYYDVECYDLDVPVPDVCGTQYQIDSYLDNATTAALLAGGKLYAPNNPKESFPPNAGWGKTYKLVQNPACPPEPEIKVVTSEWVDGAYGCGDTTVEQTRTVTTTSYVLDGNVWVENAPLVVTQTQARELTAEEIAALPCLAETGINPRGAIIGLFVALVLTAVGVVLYTVSKNRKQ
jgi:hypothetical protein